MFTSYNRAFLKHAGYARQLLTSDANSDDAAALTLKDELLHIRAANLEAAECIGHRKTQLVDANAQTQTQTQTQTQRTMKANIESAYKAMDKNTARMESLESNLDAEDEMEAGILLKRTTKGRGLFELEQERKLASLEAERRPLVNRKIQAETERLTRHRKIIHSSYTLPPCKEPFSPHATE